LRVGYLVRLLYRVNCSVLYIAAARYTKRLGSYLRAKSASCI